MSTTTIAYNPLQLVLAADQTDHLYCVLTNNRGKVRVGTKSQPLQSVFYKLMYFMFIFKAKFFVHKE